MGFAKRAFLSLSRRPGKTLILFFVILILGNLIAGTVAVDQAIRQSEEIAKRSLGASVSIGMDDQALMAAYEKGEEPEIGTLAADVIEELGTRPEVRNFDYTLSAYLASPSLKSYEATDVETISSGANFTVCGIHYAPVLFIEEGKLSLVEGRVFTEDEIREGKMVALISDKVAEANNLHTGDTIVFANEIYDYYTSNIDSTEQEPVESRDVVLEVIGIFALNSSGELAEKEGSDSAPASTASPEFDFASYELNNTIYVPIAISLAEEQFMMEAYSKIVPAEDAQYYESYTPYYTPLYLLNSVDDLESFTQAADAVMPAYYAVLSAQSQFEQVAAPLREIQSIMAIALVVASIAALVIVSLVVVLFLRDRRREFGVYLSLGVRKPAIVGQVLIETLVVALIALGIALFTGSLISDGLSQQLLVSQSSDGIYGAGEVYRGSGVSLLMDSLSLDEVLETYQVSLSAPYVLTFLGLGVGVTVLSCAVPLLYVLRLKPKKILM